MRLCVQRVDDASVEVEGREVAAIGRGWLVLVGVEKGDGEADAVRAADKLVHLRAFEDGEGRMNRALAEVGGSVLAVSQFTLAGSIDRGRRPSFDGALEPSLALPLFERLVGALRAAGAPVATGRFGAAMKVRLTNDGPVTFVYDTRRSS